MLYAKRRSSELPGERLRNSSLLSIIMFSSSHQQDSAALELCVWVQITNQPRIHCSKSTEQYSLFPSHPDLRCWKEQDFAALLEKR